MKKFIPLYVAALLLSPFVALAASFFHLSDSGDLGLGTDSPLAKLDVAGAIYSRLVNLSDASTISIDWSDGNTQAVTLGGNRTLSFSGAQAGGHYTLLLRQDTTGSRTVTWPGTIKWNGGSAPTLADAANSNDIISFVYDGTYYYGWQDYSAAPAFSISESFNSYSDGDLNGDNGGVGWSGAWSGSTAFDIQGSTTSEGAKAVKVAQGYGQEPLISRGFSTLTTGTIHLSEKKDSIDHDQGINLYAGSTFVAGVSMAGSGRSHEGYWVAIGDTQTSLGVTYSTSTFSTIDLQFDTDTDKFRVSINGGTYSSWLDFDNAVTGVDKLELSTSASGSSANGYWDDITISGN